MKHRMIGSFWKHITTDYAEETARKDALVVAELESMRDFERRDGERRQAERIDLRDERRSNTDRRDAEVAESPPFIRFLRLTRSARRSREYSIPVYSTETPRVEDDEPGCNDCDGWVVVGSVCPSCGLKGWAKE